MDGVTIVAEHFCRELTLVALITVGIIITLLVVLILEVLRKIYKTDATNKCEKTAISLSLILVIILYPFALGALIDQYNTTHMEYTVTVEDSVSFNDFHEKYKIVSVDGTEFRVVEK